MAASVHIVLLRGVNVGRAGRVRMADLVRELAADGVNVTATVVQSGNLVVKGWGRGPGELASTIEGSIADSFGFETRSLVRTRAQLQRVIDADPFAGKVTDPSKYVVHFCEPAMTQKSWDLIVGEIVEPTLAAFREGCVYQWCPLGVSNSQLISPLIERRVGSAVTARNWRTLTSLLEAC